MATAAPPPKLTGDVWVRFARIEVEQLRRIADEDCTSVSCVVRRMVRRQLKVAPDGPADVGVQEA